MKRLKSYSPPKIIGILLLLIPIIFSLAKNINLNNDTYFIIKSGNYILKHGILYIEPFTMHHNFSFVMQQWLSAIIFAVIYKTGGNLGISIFITSLFTVIIYLFYKLCSCVSDNKYYLSLFLTLLFSLIMLPIFITSRPQVISFVIYLLYFNLLERYVKANKTKYLIPLPILSLLEINLHGSLFFILPCFILPYIVEGILKEFSCFTKDKYKVGPLLITFILVLLTGFINPYGTDMLTYTYKALNNPYLKYFVTEVKPPSIKETSGLIVYLTIFAILICYYFSKRKIKIRYFLLYLGTTILTICSIRNYCYLLIAGLFPLADYYKDRARSYKKVNLTKIDKLMVIIIICFYLIIICNIVVIKPDEHPLEKVVNYLDSHTTKDVLLYNDFNEGSYLEFNGYKTYIDPRPEIFLKSINRQEDILKEYYNLQTGNLKIKDFLAKYKFTYLVLSDSDVMFYKEEELIDYKLVYSEKNYKIYIRK